MPIGSSLNITLPTSGQVQWDSPLNEALQALIDAVEAAVTVDGIDIQASLDLQGNYLINVEGLKFTTNTDDGSSRQLFFKTDGELYVRDGAGRSLQLTSSGSLNVSLNGGIGGDYASSAAQLVYSSSGTKFTFTSSPGVYATMETGDVQVHNGSSSTYVDVKASPNQGSTYNMTLPAAVPSANSVVTMDATGTLNTTRDPSVSSVTASNGLFTGITYNTGHVVFSGSLYRTQYAKSFNLSRGITPSTNVGNPTYQAGYWAFAGGGNPSTFEVEIPFEEGERIVSVKWLHMGVGAQTASLVVNPGYTTGGTSGNRYTVAERRWFTGSFSSPSTSILTTGDGYLPFKPDTSGSLVMIFSGSATQQYILSPLIVTYDRPGR